MISLRLLIISLSVAILFACDIPIAKPEQSKKLVVVSDYLKESDSTIFHVFENKTKIDVQIIEKSANEIIGVFRNTSYSSGFDIIMLKSLYDVNRLYKNNYFQSITELKPDNGKHRKFLSDKYNFIGFGIDPFLIVYNPDSILQHRTYTDLKTSSFHTDLTNHEMIPMLSSIMSKMNKVKSYDWIKGFKKYQHKPNPYSDINSYLTRYSDFQSIDLSDSVYSNLEQIHYPNQSTSGSFYDLRTFTIVSQAENYTEAKVFIHYFMKEEHNEKLNKKINTLPISVSNSKLRLYNIAPEKLLQYYGMTERILNKLN